MNNSLIYADNAATTRTNDDVVKAMLPYFSEIYGNPSTLYSKGREARRAVEAARSQVAHLINADPQEVIFTSGGTESDNTALRGIMHSRASKGKKKLITTAIEHHAILHTADALKAEGFEIVLLPVDKYGMVSPEQVEQAIDDNTALVSVMMANNEIGTIEPIAEIGKICREKGVIFHTDAVQAVGHIPVDVKAMNIDLLSLSGHKFYGPKGIGALYVRRGVLMPAFITGGGQERKIRSGTENVPAIVGLGVAAQIAEKTMQDDIRRISALRDDLIRKVTERIPYASLTGHPTDRLPGTASFTIECIEGESLILRLDNAGVCASTGSACSTGSLDPSHVLMAIGLPHEIAHGSLRLSLGHDISQQDVDNIVEKLVEVVEKLRDMSPLWEYKCKNTVKEKQNV